MYRFIVQKRYVKLMFLIDGKNIRQLSRDVNMTTSHLSNVVDQFVREELVTKKQKGREVEISLTEKGKKVVEILREYDDLEKSPKKEEEVKDGE